MTLSEKNQRRHGQQVLSFGHALNNQAQQTAHDNWEIGASLLWWI
jgi:hypothetical protein